jgi:RhtB (resistance to homoserine/threonine) family protein
MDDQLAFLGTITVIHVLGLISPGPDFIMAIRNAITYSRKIGIFTALGIALGVLVHISYGFAGLGLIISKSILIFNTIKYLGAAYLIYIGIKSIRARKSTIKVEAEKPKKQLTPMQAMKVGFLTNVLNPKATVYFLSIFTLVMTPETPLGTFAIASTIMFVTTAIWFSLVAIFFSQKTVQKTFNRFQGAFNKFFGGLLVLLGLKIAVSE